MEILNVLHSEPHWEICTSCANEVVRLYNEKWCYDCHTLRQTRTQEELRITQALAKALGPRGIAKYTFDRFQESPGNSLALRCAQDFNPDSINLFLFGPCGVGKTHLIGSIFQKFTRLGKRTLWATTRDINRTLRNRLPEEEKARIGEYVDAELLVVDDLGIGVDTPFTIAALCEIVDRRWERNRHGLAITSNFSLDLLAAKIGEDRLVSRIAGQCQIVEIKDHDHRLDKRK